MKRKKQFTALLMAVAMVVGGTFSPGIVGNAQEGQQTESDADVGQNSDADAGQNEEVVSGTGQDVATSETNAEPAADGPMAYAEGTTTESGTLDFANLFTGTLTSGKGDIAAGSTQDSQGVITLTWDYKLEYNDVSSSPKVINNIKCNNGIKINKGGSVTIDENGAVTHTGAYIIRSTKAATLTLIFDKAATAPIHFQYVKDGQLEEVTGGKTLDGGDAIFGDVDNNFAVDGSAGAEVAIEADTDYYVWIDGGKVKFWHFSYSYENESEVTPPDDQDDPTTPDNPDDVDDPTNPDNPSDVEGPVEKGSLAFGDQAGEVISEADFTKKVPANTIYQDPNGVITMEVLLKDATYEDYYGKNKKTKAVGTGEYNDNIKSGAKGAVTIDGSGVVTPTGAFRIRSTKDAVLILAMEKASQVPHFQYVDNNALVEITGAKLLTKKDNVVTSEDITFGDTAFLADGGREIEVRIEADKDYYVWMDGGNVKLWGLSYTYQGEAGITFPENVPAFPGAEGGGKYATGGRGGEVYVVTNLNDKGEGSLRYGIETAPASGRIIVFEIGGTIHLDSPLSFKDKSNITIAGQTAPGDGITIAGYDTNISDSQNIVLRFLRFRVGTENLLRGGDSMDALWGRDNDTFIIDHCTFSWNTDETLSTYRGKNGTVQWCIISESLTVSGHSKGRHGYGAIWGGDNTVFQYNLLADHTSRNPRIGGGSMTDPTSILSYATLQASNNVLYNHGYYPCYGGGFAYTNYINNYVKPGPGTRESLNDTLINIGESNKDGGFYVAGNILEGNEAITANNDLGIKGMADYKSSVPFTAGAEKPNAFDVSLVSAEECYDLVLNNAGATYPFRDSVDARIIAQVRNGTGAYINTQDEVGGYPARTVTAAEIGRTDTDGDGIPDTWELANGLDPNNAEDSVQPASKDPDDANYGYAWIEVYFNDLVKDVVKTDYAAPNPDITIDLEDNALVAEGTDITVVANATAKNGGNIAKVEFYNGAECVGIVESAPYSYTYTGLADGTYHISVRAYDNDGNATQSETSRLHVNSTAGTGDWMSADVGNPGVKGTASLTDGVLTVKGAGKLGKCEGSVEGSQLNRADTDDFQFVYQQLTGDVELVAKLDSYLAVDQHTFNGLMFRESLDADAAAVAVGLTMTKIFDGDNTVWAAFMVNRPTKGGDMSVISSTIDSASNAEKAGIPLLHGLNFKEGNTFHGIWLKITRIGDVFTTAISEDGQVWRAVGSMTIDLPDTAYVGFAVEAGKAANHLENYATAKFSNITVNEGFGTITYNLENVDYKGADQFAIGEDVVVILSTVEGYLLPNSVEVTVDGVPVEAIYDKEAGTVTLKNPAGNVVISAKGQKRPVSVVGFEEVDENDLLTVEEKDGKILLTQIAESGNIAKGIDKAPVNESFILFPSVTQFHEFTVKLKVTKLLEASAEKTNDGTGVYVGVFGVNDYAFDSWSFRPIADASQAVSAYWTKEAAKVGNGSPKTALMMDQEYTITFSDDGKNQYKVVWVDANGKSDNKVFKANECYLQKDVPVRYGIGLIGATVEISDMKLVDHEGNVVYSMGIADYTAVSAAIQKAGAFDPNDYDKYENFDAVLEAWDAVVFGLPKEEQAKVDAMAKAIEDAIAALVPVSKEGADYTAVTAALEKANALNPDDYVDFTAVKNACDAVVKDLPKEEQAKVDAMAKAIEDAIVGLQRLSAVTQDEIPAEALTDEVKNTTGATTVEALENYMKESALDGGFTDCKVMDVQIKLTLMDGTEKIVQSEADFPSGGVWVILPYPNDDVKANRENLDFKVSHLITKGWHGQEAGTLENLTPQITEAGLKVFIRSASPFSISWKEKGAVPTATPEPSATATPEPSVTATPEPSVTATPEPSVTATPEPSVTATPEPSVTATPEPSVTATPEPTATATPVPDDNSDDNDDDDDNEEDVEEVVENKTSQTAKTGDHMDVFAMVWGIALIAAVTGVGTVWYLRRRKENS